MPKPSKDPKIRKFVDDIRIKKIAIKQTKDPKLKEMLKKEKAALEQQKAKYIQNQHPER